MPYTTFLIVLNFQKEIQVEGNGQSLVFNVCK